MTDSECPKCECHGSVHCPDVDWEMQRRFDASPLKQQILDSIANPGQRRPRPIRPPREA